MTLGHCSRSDDASCIQTQNHAAPRRVKPILAPMGLRTLLLDLDPQASAARWADRRQHGAVDVDVAVESPARLAAALLQAEREGYALVVLDTAPHADQAALQAARAADLVLVP